MTYAGRRHPHLGIRNEVVQSILNHAVPGVGGVYLRSELEKQKAEALAMWATTLARIVGQDASVWVAAK